MKFRFIVFHNRKKLVCNGIKVFTFYISIILSNFVSLVRKTIQVEREKVVIRENNAFSRDTNFIIVCFTITVSLRFIFSDC